MCKHGVAACQDRENETPRWLLQLPALAEGKIVEWARSTANQEGTCLGENGLKGLQVGEMCVRAVSGERRALLRTVTLSVCNGASGCSPVTVHAMPAATAA